MSGNSTFKRHLGIIRAQVVGVVVAAILGLAIAGASLPSQNSEQSAQTTAQEQVEARNDFYLVLAGEKDGKANSSSDKLAGDITVLLGENSSEASLNGVVEQVNAAALDYPNITEEIGFSPFRGSGSCGECGRLSDQMVAHLRTIVIEGDIDSLIEPVPELDTTKTLTLAGMPVWMEIFLLWQIGGGLGLAYGLIRHGDHKMTWVKAAPHDRSRVYGFWLAPIPFAAYHLIYNRPKLAQHRAHNVQIIDNANLSEPLMRLESRLSELYALPSGERMDPEIQRVITQFEDRRDRILAYPSSLSTRQRKDALKGLGAGDEDLLQEVEDALKAHEEAADDVSSW